MKWKIAFFSAVFQQSIRNVSMKKCSGACHLWWNHLQRTEHRSCCDVLFGTRCDYVKFSTYSQAYDELMAAFCSEFWREDVYFNTDSDGNIWALQHFGFRLVRELLSEWAGVFKLKKPCTVKLWFAAKLLSELIKWFSTFWLISVENVTTVECSMKGCEMICLSTIQLWKCGWADGPLTRL